MTNTEQALPVRNTIMWVVKPFVTIALGWFLFTQADWSAIGATLTTIPTGVVVLAFIFMLLSITISAYKWRVILKLHGADFSFSKLHRYYFIGVFFSNFLPSSVGGDGYRIYKTYDNPRSNSSAVIAVMMDRLIGLLALLVVGYVCAFIVYRSQGDFLSGTFLSFGTAGIVTALLIALAMVVLRCHERLRRWRDKPRLLRILLEHGKDYVRNPRATAYAVLISLFYQVYNGMSFYLLLRYGVGVDISIPELFVVLTLVNLVGVLPISINGLGVIDGAFVILLGVYGVDNDLALSVMLVSRLLLIFISLIGAAFHVSERMGPPRQVESAGASQRAQR